MSSSGVSHKGDVHVQVATFIAQLKRRQISGSPEVGKATANLLVRYISATRWSKVSQLIEDVRALGKSLIAAQPREFAVGNVVRRVLALIREVGEASAHGGQNAASNASHTDGAAGAASGPLASSMFGLLSTAPSSTSLSSTPANIDDLQMRRAAQAAQRDLKGEIIEGIHELIDEIGNIDDTIASMSVEMIHENEVLLTPNPASQTVLEFLLRASQKREFTVLVTEGFPNDITKSHDFAVKLAKAGIQTVIIPDSAVSAVMSRVGKVIIGTRSVLANGGCISSPGVAMVCECAKEFRVPVLAVSGLYKLSPLYPFDIEQLIEVGDTGKVVRFSDAKLMNEVQVINPTYDYIGPEFIDIYVTNVGGFSPSFTYRIVLDHYSDKDVTL